MSERITRKSWNDIKPSHEELETLDALSDEEVARRVAADPDAPPPPDVDWWRNAEVVAPRKQPVTLRLDPDILAWFREQGPGYQTRINAVLRHYMETVGDR
ncbi:BrnA antitoxin family protein [uncultured Rhodospira sp.]|uniref:BrnA antitoxin family protein n=1 Tax=uncultured Rhodospira sp. TaxID=1936189 RepID=UPI00260930E8|nr:BrnA antitoxin family protein [uncultured Rhodospira sp.]